MYETKDRIGGGFTTDGKPIFIRKIDDVDGPLIGFLCKDEITGNLFEDTVSYDCTHIRDEEYKLLLSGEVTDW